MDGYKSKVDIIYEILIDQISRGYYKAGDRLIISQVARENSVSDIPVREAIRCLEREGYVELTANQGAVVCSFTKDRLHDIFQIKAVLEGYAARVSIDHLSEQDFEELRAHNRRLERAVEAGDIKEYSQLNTDFHLRIYRVMPNRELYNMIVDVWKKYSVTKSVFSLAPKRAGTAISEHDEILGAMERGEYGKVEQLMRAHKMQAGYELINELELREKVHLAAVD